mgnify:CR=1 FL=1
MACNLSSGYSIPCRDSVGGIKNWYILSGSVSSYAEASTGLVSGISGSGVFYKFEQQKENGSLNEEVTANLQNGSVYYTQNAEIVLHKLQASIRNQVATMAKNTELLVVAETQNGLDSSDSYSGRYFLMGRYNGAALTAGAGSSGTAFADQSGYNVTLTAMEPSPLFEVKSTDGTLTSALDGITVS